MSERAYNRALQKQEAEEIRLLTEAVERFYVHPGLRLLLWRFIESCSMAPSPFSSDPLTMARNCGMMEAAHNLRHIFDSIDPTFLPALQTEMTARDRTNAELLAERLNNDTAD